MEAITWVLVAKAYKGKISIVSLVQVDQPSVILTPKHLFFMQPKSVALKTAASPWIAI